MAHIINPRRGRRAKAKSRMEMLSATETQRTTWPLTEPKNGKRQEDPTSMHELNLFFDTIPDEIEKNDILLLQKLNDAWRRKDVECIFQLIRENKFPGVVQKKVLSLWDAAHYLKAERESVKPLTPLARFRIRERNIPPPSICPTGSRPKATLPKQATRVLRAWLEKNPRPYPTREDKEALAACTGLTVMQVNTWFANTRRRMSGKRSKPQKDHSKRKESWKWTSPPLWQVPIIPPAISSASAFTSCSGVCACPASLPQVLTPTSLGPNLPIILSEPVSNTTRALIDWPASHAVSNQYPLSASVVALTPSQWKPEFEYCGLHAARAAQILMEMHMTSK